MLFCYCKMFTRRFVFSNYQMPLKAVWSQCIYDNIVMSQEFQVKYSGNYLWLYLHHCQNTPESARVQFSAACIWSIPSSPFWTPFATPKNCPPRAIVIQRLLFFSVFARCAQSALVTVQRGLCERDHTKPQIVLIQLPTLRLDNSPWREGPEKWIRPLALTFFPVHLPPDWRGRGPHSWAPSLVPVLLAISYWPVFSKWTLIIYLLHRRLFDLMSPLNVFLELAQTCGKIRSHQSWGRSPEICTTLTFCIAAAEQTLHHNNYVEIEE